jgi:hypothetical protein
MTWHGKKSFYHLIWREKVGFFWCENSKTIQNLLKKNKNEKLFINSRNSLSQNCITFTNRIGLIKGNNVENFSALNYPAKLLNNFNLSCFLSCPTFLFRYKISAKKNKLKFNYNRQEGETKQGKTFSWFFKLNDS